MKNIELIRILLDMPLDIEVFLSSDEEGNSFSPVTDAEVSLMVADDPYREYSPIHEDDLEDYEDVDLEQAIYLWP